MYQDDNSFPLSIAKGEYRYVLADWLINLNALYERVEMFRIDKEYPVHM